MRHQKRILCVQDISCFGKCSNTVALPVLSAAGHECVVLPTALLSTHTGGFTGYSFLDLTGEMERIVDHWSRLHLSFDGVQTGYFGSLQQLQIVKDYLHRTQKEACFVCVDPVMGDNGALYSIYDEAFVAGMRSFCAGADVITPNVTEAALLSGLTYVPQPDHKTVQQYVDGLGKLGVKQGILTGVPMDGDQIGILAVDFATGNMQSFHTPFVKGYLHGTGDVFTSALCGYLMQDLPFFRAAQQALQFTYASILASEAAPEKYGLCFETQLYRLIPSSSASVTQ